MQVRKINHKETAEAEKLRVSNVNLQMEEEEKFVELTLDNQSNNSGEKSGNESNLQIYPPSVNQISPVRQGRQGRNAESNEKFFDHLKSHRQE